MKTIKELIEEQYPVGAAESMLESHTAVYKSHRQAEVMIEGTEPEHATTVSDKEIPRYLMSEDTLEIF